MKMETPLLSYIIPVYNTAAWVGECLASVLGHKGSDVECVVVDDGSTDGSPEIIGRFAAADSRVRIISRTNGGLSEARNTGLRHAKGRYVLFVDSDDIVDPGAVAAMLGEAVADNADVAAGRIMCLSPDGSVRPWGVFMPPSSYPSGTGLMKEVDSRSLYFPMVFGYMVRRRFLLERGISFEPGLIHEDELWTPLVLARAGRTIVTGYRHYTYRTNREGSITSEKNSFERCLSLGKIVRCLFKEALRLTHSDCAGMSVLHFYRNRMSALVSAIYDLSRRSAPLSLVGDFAAGHYADLCGIMRNSYTTEP